MSIHRKATANDEASQRPSRPLRDVLTVIEHDLDDLTREVIENLRREIPAYAAIRDETMLAEIFAHVRENLGIVFESFLEGRDLPPDRFAHVAQVIRKRASQNIPLDALLRAYRVSCPLIWAAILDAARSNSSLRDEILFKLSPRVLYHFDLFSRVVQQAYVIELKDRFRHRDQAKRELSRVALDGTADEQTLRAAVAALGLDPLGLYSAIAFELRGPQSDPLYLSAEITRLLDALVRAFGGSQESFVETLVQGMLIAWLAHSPLRPALKATDDLLAACRGLFEEDSVAVRAGVSTALRGVGNWKIAAEQAQKALEIGKTLQPARNVYRYSSVAIRDFVSRTPEVAGFLQTVLEFLSGEEELLKSAEAYFATGRHLKMTAAELGVHRNTLTYRLRRIEQLLGGSFDDSDWSLRLQLALTLRQTR